jgi:hypothetical protein
MNDRGRLTIWTAFLVLAGIALALAGAILAPDRALYTWLFVAAFGATWIAFSNVLRKVRDKVREREIRDEERARLTEQGRP